MSDNPKTQEQLLEDLQVSIQCNEKLEAENTALKQDIQTYKDKIKILEKNQESFKKQLKTAKERIAKKAKKIVRYE